MSALVAQELEVALLESPDNKELVVIPPLVVLHEETCESFVTCPSHGYPFKLLLLLLSREVVNVHVVLDWQFSVDVVLDLLNGRVTSLLLRRTCILLRQGQLKPVSHFEYIPSFQILIRDVHIVTTVRLNWLVVNRF